MANALVAKSYQNLEQVTEPYSVNGRMYVKVRMKSGDIKQVRAYSEKEYARYNSSSKPVETPKITKTRRNALGFGKKGFIWIFKGDTYSNLDWFRISPCRYTRVWGWYLPSDIELPDPMPTNIEPVKLEWSLVSRNDDLISEDEIVKVVDGMLYDAGESRHIGNVGDRLDFVATCVRATSNPNSFGGISYFYVFEDEDKNVYTWGTSARVLEEGITYHIRGTVKDHGVFRNVKQNALTRCKVEET